MDNREILQPLYNRYGKGIDFKLLSNKDEKIVYEMKTSDDVLVVMIMPHLSITRFHKYMRSLGMQQKLFSEGFNVAEVIDTYMVYDNLVSVQKKLKGTNTFERNEKSMVEIGKLVGRLHNLTFSPQYKNTCLLVNYPDRKKQLKLKLYDFWFSKIANPLKYFLLRGYPKGICHRDVNPKNVLLGEDGKYYLIDFDVHRYQPFVEGIVRFYSRKIKDKSLFGAFLKGYEQERTITAKEKEYLKKELQMTI